MTANLLTLNSSKTEFLLIRLKQELAKIQNCSLSTTHSARNIGFVFDEHLSFSIQNGRYNRVDECESCRTWKVQLFGLQITALSKSCNFHIRQLCCICPFLDINTASIIATSIIHSKLDYWNSLYYNLPNSQLSRLQHIQNSRACFKAPKFSHTTPILKSLHWLKVNERIKYKILSLTYKTHPEVIVIHTIPHPSPMFHSMVPIVCLAIWLFSKHSDRRSI